MARMIGYSHASWRYAAIMALPRRSSATAVRPSMSNRRGRSRITAGEMSQLDTRQVPPFFACTGEELADSYRVVRAGRAWTPVDARRQMHIACHGRVRAEFRRGQVRA